eukprot:Skav222130  [mRNA]  locus=scaffold1181:829571:832257:+ [translate_table: standard]
MATWQESWPWTCGKCRWNNGKAADYCAKCGKHWQSTAPPRQQEDPKRRPSKPPKKPQTQHWDWKQQADHAPEQGKPKRRPRSKHPKEQKEKKGKEGYPSDKPPDQGGGALSPFGYPGPGSSNGPPPWATQENSPFQGLTPPLSPSPSLAATSINVELMTALRKEYKGKEETMPESVREILERSEQEKDRLHIKSLHVATTALGKAKRSLGEVAEARRSHRMAWTKHLSESVQLWEKQLADFRKQQAAYQEQATAATDEVNKAKKTIHNLNTGGKGEVILSDDEQEPVPELTADQEEEKLCAQLATIYKAIASSLGVDVTTFERPKDALHDTDSGLEDEDKGAKRPCAYQVEECSSTGAACRPGCLPFSLADKVTAQTATWAAQLQAVRLRAEVLYDSFREFVNAISTTLTTSTFDHGPRLQRVPEGDSSPPPVHPRPGDPLADDPTHGLPELGAPLDAMPAFVQSLHETFVRESAVERIDEGPVLYATTWCLIAEGRRLSYDNRPIRLDSGYQQWPTSIADLWSDVFDPAAVPWHVWVVRPAPLVPTGHPPGVHLILFQTEYQDEVAAVVSVRWRSATVTRLQHIAVVLPSRVYRDDILAATRLDRFCDNGRICEALYYDELIQRRPGPGTQLENGAGIVFEIGAPPHQARYLYGNMVGPQDTSTATAPAVVGSFDASAGDLPVPLSGSDESEDDDDDDYSDARSRHDHDGTDGQDGLQPLAVYQLHRPPRRLAVRMATYEGMVSHVAALMHIDEDDIIALHTIHAAVQGEESHINNVIMQRVGDLPVGSPGKLILQDVELHGMGATYQPPHTQRSVLAVNNQLARQHLLEAPSPSVDSGSSRVEALAPSSRGGVGL